MKITNYFRDFPGGLFDYATMRRCPSKMNEWKMIISKYSESIWCSKMAKINLKILTPWKNATLNLACAMEWPNITGNIKTNLPWNNAQGNNLEISEITLKLRISRLQNWKKLKMVLKYSNGCHERPYQQLHSPRKSLLKDAKLKEKYFF